MPAVTPTDSAAPVAALSGITRSTVSVPPPALDRLSVPPSAMLRVPAASVPPPVLLVMLAPLTTALTVLDRLTPPCRSSTEAALLRLIAALASVAAPPMANVALPTLVLPA